MKKWMKMSGSILYVVVFTVMIACIIVVLSSRTTGGDPQIFGYQFKQVLSGSMEPEFSTGSLIVVKEVTSPEALKKGDIITFQTKQDQSYVTHRIVGMKGKGPNKAFETKGDHNMYQDGTLVKADQVAAQYTGVTIPYAGKASFVCRDFGWNCVAAHYTRCDAARLFDSSFCGRCKTPKTHG